MILHQLAVTTKMVSMMIMVTRQVVNSQLITLIFKRNSFELDTNSYILLDEVQQTSKGNVRRLFDDSNTSFGKFTFDYINF